MPDKLSQFWQELKRRRVIQVIVFYATASFVIIELVNNVTEPLHLPGWTPTFTIIVLIIGFPLALIFSWIFDLSSKGIERTRSVDDVRTDVERYDTSSIKRGKYWGRIINIGLLGILSIIIATYLIVRYGNFDDPVQVRRFTYQIPTGYYLARDNWGSSISLSPNGALLAFVAVKSDTSHLFLKYMNEFEASQIAESEGARAPFFSPDNKWIGYFSNGFLRKVAITGGVPQTICEAKSGYGGTWGQDNAIIFGDHSKSCLMQVSSNGGTPKQLTTALRLSSEEAEHTHSWPQFLPDGKTILFTISGPRENNRIVAQSLKTGKRRSVIEPGNNAIYSSTGHLIYSWKGDLFAVSFDPDKLEPRGQPFAIYKGIMMDEAGSYSISNEGSLIYIPGDYVEYDNTLVLVDQQGVTEKLNFTVSQSPRFSPDGSQILILGARHESGLWIYGLERGEFRRFSEKGYFSYWAIWTPDGSGIAYNSNRHGGNAVSLYLKNSDGTGDAKRLTFSDYHQPPKCWSADGKYLIFSEGIHPNTGMDILMLPMEGDSTPIPLLASRFNETHPILSPDGQWLAYVSDISGGEEVFVRSFPDMGELKQISTDGGTEPLWAPDGRMIYYRNITGDILMKVAVQPGPEFTVGKPEVQFQGRLRGSSGPWGRNYDISPDGKKFLMIEQEIPNNEATRINIILDWTEELRLHN